MRCIATFLRRRRAAAQPSAPSRARDAGRLAFPLVCLASTADALGMSVLAVALPMVAVTTLRAEAGQVSLLAAAAWLPALLLGLPAGWAVDRLAPRTVMRLADASLALLLTVLAGLAAAGGLTVPLLTAAGFLAGALTVLAAAGYRTVLPTVVPTGRLPASAARMQGGEWTARIAAPSVAGLLVPLSAAAAVLFSAGTALLAFVAVSAVRPVHSPATSSGPRPGAGVGAGARFLLADPLLRALTLFAAGSATGRAMVQAVQVLFLLQEVRLAPGLTGLLLSAGGIGGILGALTGPRLAGRLGSGRALLAVQLGSLPVVALMPLAGAATSAALFAAGAFAAGFSLVSANVTITAFRLVRCPPELLGRVSATMVTSVYGAMPLGALAAGAVATAGGARAAMWAGLALSGLAVAGLAAGPVRRYRDLPTQPPG